MSGWGDDAIHAEHLGLRWDWLSHKLGVDCKLQESEDAWGVVFGQSWLPHIDKVLGWQDMKAPGLGGGSLVWLAPCWRLLAFSCISLGKVMGTVAEEHATVQWQWINRLNFYTSKTSVGGIQLLLAMRHYLAHAYLLSRGPCQSCFTSWKTARHQWPVKGISSVFSFRVKSTDRWS